MLQYQSLRNSFSLLCVRVAIQMMLTIAVSIAGDEKSFSKLNLILPCLEASIREARRQNVALLSIEKEEHPVTGFNEIVGQFASVTASKVQL